MQWNDGTLEGLSTSVKYSKWKNAFVIWGNEQWNDEMNNEMIKP